MKEGEGVLQIRNDRCAFHPYGLYGGRPGKLGRNVLNPGTPDETPLTGKVTRDIRQGDVFRYEMAGAGGWGDPFERDPERVLRDVRNEYVSLEAALEEYGVVIDAGSWTVDEGATTKLREDLRSTRGELEAPFVDRGPLPPGVKPMSSASSPVPGSGGPGAEGVSGNA